jgi:hypothetical protein
MGAVNSVPRWISALAAYIMKWEPETVNEAKEDERAVLNPISQVVEEERETQGAQQSSLKERSEDFAPCIVANAANEDAEIAALCPLIDETGSLEHVGEEQVIGEHEVASDAQQLPIDETPLSSLAVYIMKWTPATVNEAIEDDRAVLKLISQAGEVNETQEEQQLPCEETPEDYASSTEANVSNKEAEIAPLCPTNQEHVVIESIVEELEVHAVENNSQCEDTSEDVSPSLSENTATDEADQSDSSAITIVGEEYEAHSSFDFQHEVRVEIYAAAEVDQCAVLSLTESGKTPQFRYLHDADTLVSIRESVFTSSPALNELAKEIVASKIARNMEQMQSSNLNPSISNKSHFGIYEIEESSNALTGDTNSPPAISEVIEEEEAPLSHVHSLLMNPVAANDNTQSQNAQVQEIAPQRAPRSGATLKSNRLREQMIARQKESLQKHYTRVGKAFNSSRGLSVEQNPVSSEGRTAEKVSRKGTKEKRVPVWQKTTESFRAKTVFSCKASAKVHPTGE